MISLYGRFVFHKNRFAAGCNVGGKGFMLYIELIIVTFFLAFITCAFTRRKCCLKRLKHLRLLIKGIDKYDLALIKIRENTDDSLQSLQKEAFKSYDKINDYYMQLVASPYRQSQRALADCCMAVTTEKIYLFGKEINSFQPVLDVIFMLDVPGKTASVMTDRARNAYSLLETTVPGNKMSELITGVIELSASYREQHRRTSVPLLKSIEQMDRILDKASDEEKMNSSALSKLALEKAKYEELLDLNLTDVMDFTSSIIEKPASWHIKETVYVAAILYLVKEYFFWGESSKVDFSTKGSKVIEDTSILSPATK